MRVPWWRSIRWRLALGSILVYLLATTLLAITVIIAVNYYYGVDLRQRLTTLAIDTAGRLGVSYAQNGNLPRAITSVLPEVSTQATQNQDFLLLVFNKNRQLLYPRFGAGTKPLGQGVAALVLASNDPSLQRGDYARLFNAVLAADRGTTTIDQIGQSGPGGSARLFAALPIYTSGRKSTPLFWALVAGAPPPAGHTRPPVFGTTTALCA